MKKNCNYNKVFNILVSMLDIYGNVRYVTLYGQKKSYCFTFSIQIFQVFMIPKYLIGELK